LVCVIIERQLDFQRVIMAPQCINKVCCFELKTAVLVIGVFNLVAALFGILGSAIGAGGVGVGIAAVNGAFGNFSLQDNADQLSPEEKAQLDQIANTFGNGGGSDKEAINGALGGAFVLMIALLVICVLYVVVASLLIHGARKGKPGLLMPWLVLTVISFIYDLVQLITTINNNLGVNPTKMGINCGLIGCHMAIASWLILIVWSFRQQLRGGNAPTPKP